MSEIHLIECFSELEDPRIDRTKLHKLEDILLIAIMGVICGANDWVNIELFGQAKEDWLRQYLELPNGIPSHDTFGRVFRQLDGEQFEKGFIKWITSLQERTKGEIIAIDGKTLRRSHDNFLGKKAIHIVDAWASENQMTLGQVKVDEKSNEITAIPKLLEMLVIEGGIVTIDAMGCQAEIAKKIIEKEADYVLAVKKNQGQLYEHIKHLFEVVEKEGFECVEHDHIKTVSKHGRIEIRECWTISEQDYLEYLPEHYRWKNLKAIVMVDGLRKTGEQTEKERRFYISSLNTSAKEILYAIRTHWQVENSLNWVLDVTFREDDSRIRKDNGAHNFAILRRIALNLLKQETTVKRSVQGKRFLAGWDHKYLHKVLFGE